MWSILARAFYVILQSIPLIACIIIIMYMCKIGAKKDSTWQLDIVIGSKIKEQLNFWGTFVSLVWESLHGAGSLTGISHQELRWYHFTLARYRHWSGIRVFNSQYWIGFYYSLNIMSNLLHIFVFQICGNWLDDLTRIIARNLGNYHEKGALTGSGDRVNIDKYLINHFPIGRSLYKRGWTLCE